MERLLKKLAIEVLEPNKLVVAVDSTGVERGVGGLWRLVKWDKSFIHKSSSLFRKLHLVVDVKTRLILAVKLTVPSFADSKGFGGLMKGCGKRLWRRFKRLHADRGYFTENIVGFCYQEGIFPVIQCKRNSKTTSPVLGKLVLLQKRHKAVYRKNYRPGRRWVVEQVIGEVKNGWLPLRAHKQSIRDLELLSHLVRYNLEKYLQKKVMPKNNF